MKTVISFFILTFSFVYIANANAIVNENTESRAISITLVDMDSYNEAMNPNASNEVICNCSWWWWGNNNCLASNGGRRCSTGTDCQQANSNCGGENPKEVEIAQ